MKDPRANLTNQQKLEILLEYFSTNKTTPKLKKLGEYVMQGDREGVEEMLKKGVDPDFDVGSNGLTPVILAIKHNKLDILKYLLKNEISCASPNIPDNDYICPMNHAIRDNNIEAIKILIQFEACETREHPQLHEACQQDPVNKEIIEMLLIERYCPAFKDCLGKSAYDYLRDKSNKDEIFELFKVHGFEENKVMDEKKRQELMRKVDLIFTQLALTCRSNLPQNIHSNI